MFEDDDDYDEIIPYVEPKFIIKSTTTYRLDKDNEIFYGEPKIEVDHTNEFSLLRENIGYRDKNQKVVKTSIMDDGDNFDDDLLDVEYVVVSDLEYETLEMDVIKVRFIDRETFFKVKNILEDYYSIYREFE